MGAQFVVSTGSNFYPSGAHQEHLDACNDPLHSGIESVTDLNVTTKWADMYKVKEQNKVTDQRLRRDL